jgi:hypothetical protein
MSKTKVSKTQKEESIVNKAKPKVSTKSVVEKKVATPKPTIASLTKELEELKLMYETVIKGKDDTIATLRDMCDKHVAELHMVQRPWYVKMFDLFANK